MTRERRRAAGADSGDDRVRAEGRAGLERHSSGGILPVSSGGDEVMGLPPLVRGVTVRVQRDQSEEVAVPEAHGAYMLAELYHASAEAAFRARRTHATER